MKAISATQYGSQGDVQVQEVVEATQKLMRYTLPSAPHHIQSQKVQRGTR